jgi:hypothetical protein
VLEFHPPLQLSAPTLTLAFAVGSKDEGRVGLPASAHAERMLIAMAVSALRKSGRRGIALASSRRTANRPLGRRLVPKVGMIRV